MGIEDGQYSQIVELPNFTRLVTTYLSDDEYNKLQCYLIKQKMI